MKGKIEIHDFKVRCQIGVYDEERKEEQEIAFDLVVEYDILQCALSDSIIDTINYEELAEICKHLAETKNYHLLETFAFESLHAIFSKFPIQYARIKVKKKKGLSAAAFTAVELERTE
jgi:dihydroneopterin aldolase